MESKTRYFMRQTPLQGFVPGYGCVPEKLIDPAVAQLAGIIERAMASRVG